ncbi:MAG: mechanosensitive ion channel domain-containing protein [Pseudomonadota bacterium]
MTPMQTLHSPLADLWAEMGDPARLTEIGLLSTLIVLTWLGMEVLRRRLRAGGEARRLPSDADWRQLLLPAALLPGVLLGRVVLGHWQSVHLFNLAVPLLVAMLAIQGVFFFLRRIFKPSKGVQALQRTVSWLAWGILALHLTGYLEEVVAAMEHLGFNVGQQRLSLYSLVMGLFWLAITLMVALWLARQAEDRLETLPLHANLRLALAKLARGLLLVLAVLVTLPLVGIDITVLSVFGGALGIGLGLGLQKVAANYVSGFTLLLDQSIRIGDMVTVGTQFGEVTQIATRYTVIRGLDGSETIIPNETLITSAVVNHSLSAPDNLVAIPVQVAYDSDLRRVEAILLRIAAAHPRVMPEHEPKVRLVGFGENGIDLKLVVWIRDPEEGQVALVSDINWAIWDAFRGEGIEIPYPQRVVYIRQDAQAAVTKAQHSATIPDPSTPCP